MCPGGGGALSMVLKFASIQHLAHNANVAIIRELIWTAPKHIKAKYLLCTEVACMVFLYMNCDQPKQRFQGQEY